MSTRSYKKELFAIAKDENVKKLKKYYVHGATSIYDHSFAVAKIAGTLAKRLHIKVDERSLARGAMLHDFYLYQRVGFDPGHGSRHVGVALTKAKKTFELNQLEEEIIKTHMWPINPSQVPKSKESILVCTADKLCALKERGEHIGRWAWKRARRR